MWYNNIGDSFETEEEARDNMYSIIDFDDYCSYVEEEEEE